jgi:hypothetical protein
MEIAEREEDEWGMGGKMNKGGFLEMKRKAGIPKCGGRR